MDWAATNLAHFTSQSSKRLDEYRKIWRLYSKTDMLYLVRYYDELMYYFGMTWPLATALEKGIDPNENLLKDAILRRGNPY